MCGTATRWTVRSKLRLVDFVKYMVADEDVLMLDVGKVLRVGACVDDMEVGNYVPLKDVLEDLNAAAFVIW